MLGLLAPVWPILGRILVGLFATSIGALIGRVLIALGIGYLTFKGLDALVGYTLTQFQQSYSGLPSVISNFLSFAGVDKAVSIIGSAFTVAFSIKTGKSSIINKFVLKGKS